MSSLRVVVGDALYWIGLFTFVIFLFLGGADGALYFTGIQCFMVCIASFIYCIIVDTVFERREVYRG